MIVVAVVGLAALGGWFLLTQPPPACATDIPEQKAEVLFNKALREHMDELWMEGPLTDADIGTFKVVSIYRKDEDDWPTYFVGGEGTVKGARREIVAIGNGCGLGDLQDLGTGPTITRIPSPPSTGGRP